MESFGLCDTGLMTTRYSSHPEFWGNLCEILRRSGSGLKVLWTASSWWWWLLSKGWLAYLMKLWRMKDKIRRVPGSDQDVYKRSFGRRNSKLCDWPESSFRTNENSWYRWWAKMMKQILSVLPRPSTYLVRYIIIRCMIVNYLTRGSHLGFVIEIITLEVLQAPSKALDRLRGLGFRFQDGVLTPPPPFLVHWP